MTLKKKSYIIFVSYILRKVFVIKKALKVILIVILVLAIGVGAVALWQWDNIEAMFVALNYSQEEIDTLVVENENKTNEILDKLTESKMNELSKEEQEMLSRGELSEQEAIDIIKGNRDRNAKSDENDKDDEKDEQKNDISASKKKIDDIISRIYLLRAEFVGALSSLESEAVAIAASLPLRERTLSNKLKYIESYTGRAVSLERQCDSKMEGLIAELKAELEKTGGNTGVISEIRSVYASEKAIKKSQLFSKYSKYLK